MQIKPVIEMLTPEGLGPPCLHALIPNEDNYSVLLMQPQGQIEASDSGVRHQNSDLANRQFRGFLEDAFSSKIDLAVTPEYSMPWATLADAIKSGHTPRQGALWALGCESIKPTELAALKQELAPNATVLYEPLQPDSRRFVNPLTYVFLAPSANGGGSDKLILLVQFKTCPMADDGHFEINNMQKGTQIYEFGGNAQQLRLVSLICSDALGFKDTDAEKIHDRALIIHIQLNANPRHDVFRQYRTKILQLNGDSTEIICLNWAKDVHCTFAGQAACWKNISGSAWYLRPNDFDHQDQTLSDNHQRGLYYTWCKSLRSHVLFFNYEPATYQLTATKVAHTGVSAPLSRRRGPQLNAMRVWNDETSKWVNHTTPADGFASIITECGDAQLEIKRIADANPFNAERVLALSTGNFINGIRWHELRAIDSCGIDASEVIHRMTYCQDTDSGAYAFRIARLKRCGHLWNILKTETNLPPALADLKTGFHLDWTSTAHHQNIISNQGRRATAIYMGEEATDSQIEEAQKKAADYLHRDSANVDSSIEAKQRLCVWYRNKAGQIVLFNQYHNLKYDDPRSTSEFDIARGT